MVSLQAFTGTVEVPGLGRVHGAAFYDLYRGETNRSAPGRRSLMPPTLHLEKGTTVELRLYNRLTTIDATDPGTRIPDETNVHTHGLIVAPTGIGFATGHPKLGDCVLPLARSSAGDASRPHHHPGARTAPLASDPCAPESPAGMPVADSLTYSYAIAADHPSGLFWIHPHPHGQSEIQVSNGLSGLLTIGSVWDSMYFGCRISAAPSGVPGACTTQQDQMNERALQKRAMKEGLRVREIGLKDIQVRQRTSVPGHRAEYDLIAFTRRPATAAPPAEIEAFKTTNDPRKTRCGDPTRPTQDNDVLLPDTPMPKGVCRNKDDGAAWVFTVSGQVFPRITVAAGSTELWRLANLSADVSYRLQLKGADGQIYKMRPVAIDGVAIPSPQPDKQVGSAAGSKAASTSGTAVAEIVLMPSARIEVVVERCDATDTTSAGCVPADKEVHATLHTRGIATGNDDNGDLWPAIDLAEVVFRAGAKPHHGVLPSRLAVLPPLRVTAGTAMPIRAEPPAGTPAMVDAPTSAAASAATAPPACASDTHGPSTFPIGGTQARLIRLNNETFEAGTPQEDEAFGIHDELISLSRLSTGSPVTIAGLADEGATRGGDSVIADIRLPNPCQPVDKIENFRSFYRPFDPTRDNITVAYGTEEYWLVVNDSLECHNFHIHQMKFSVVDADFRGSAAALAGGAPIASDQCAGDRTAIRPINQTALLDNYPLPPSARVLFKIRFDGPKLGRFVFHCHILEHEDKGMMGLVNVKLGLPQPS